MDRTRQDGSHADHREGRRRDVEARESSLGDQPICGTKRRAQVQRRGKDAAEKARRRC